MIGLEISFELGRYHATPWGAHVNDGAVEWPPSPWRLLRALYSASRTNTTLEDRRVATDRALQALADAPPPLYELPPARAGHTRHYMPKPSYSPVATGETTKVIDSYLAFGADAPLKVWWDTHLDAEAAGALAATAQSVGYLGRSESVCSISFEAGAPSADRPFAAPLAAEPPTGDLEIVELLCPAPRQPLDAFAISVTELRRQRRLVPPGTRRVTYGVPREAGDAPPVQAGTGPLPTLAMLRLRGPARPGLTEAVAVGQALRRALQSRFGSSGGGASPTFSGRKADQPRSDQHRHAHYLAAPEADGPRIDRLYVWAPEGLGPREVSALAAVSHISWPGVPRPGLRCALTALGTEEGLALPPLFGPARSWQSLTPFGLVRHPKRRGGELVDSAEEQVRRELAYRGLPEEAEVTLEKGSWHRFRSSKAGTSRLDRASLVGVRITFAQPVAGPIALGALSHYGLGLMQPSE